MPQMSPMWWTLLMMLFFLTFSLMMNIIFFNFNTKVKSMLNKNMKNMNWTW